MKSDAHQNRAVAKRRGKQYSAAVILLVVIGALLAMLFAVWTTGCPAYARLGEVLGGSQGGQCLGRR